MSDKKIHILLADDDEDDRYFFSAALKSIDIPFELTSLLNGEEAVSYFKAGKALPDFIFLDVNMPKTDGVECLRFIKNLYPSSDLSVVMLSTASSSKLLEETRKWGATAYIEKPSQVSDLVKYLRYCLTELKLAPSGSAFLLNGTL